MKKKELKLADTICCIANKVTRVSIFVKHGRIEFVLMLAFFVALLLFIGTNGQVSLGQSLLSCILLSLMLHKLYQIVYGTKYLNELSQQEKLIFKGNLRDLVLVLINHGFVLKEKIGIFYVLTTNYKIFPNSTLVVEKEGDYHSVQGKQVVINQLKELICSEVLCEKSKIDNHYAKGARKNNCYSSDTAMVVKVNTDKKCE